MAKRILGPILYAIFISPLFDIVQITFYADDGLKMVRNRDKNVLAELIQMEIKNIESWLSKSGMKVNESKTCLCLFHHQDTAPISITLNGVQIVSKTRINILGVIFDQKLQWADHIAHCVSKANKALLAIKLIKKFFTTKELLQLITSNFYSIMYYNSEIWHLQSLKVTLKQKLLSASARAIKICTKMKTDEISFIKLHEIYGRATPDKFLLYKHALTLYKLLNTTDHTLEWAAINYNQVFTSRQTHFVTTSTNLKRVGLNALSNRLNIINHRIPLSTFNKSFDTFKMHCKKEFLV